MVEREDRDAVADAIQLVGELLLACIECDWYSDSYLSQNPSSANPPVHGIEPVLCLSEERASFCIRLPFEIVNGSSWRGEE